MDNEYIERVVYIWIDSNIENLENLQYTLILKEKYPTIAIYKRIEEALEYFKKVKFNVTYIIVSGSLFAEFKKKLDKIINEIYTVPKIIIFTSETTKKKIETIDVINDSFYNNGGIVLDCCDLLSFLNANFYTRELRRLRRERDEGGEDFNFELLKEEKDFIGALYLSRLFKEPKEEECLKFDKYLLSKYQNDGMQELISQVYKVKCPTLLRIKYWLRAYTLQTNFYNDMNSDLMRDKIEPYKAYIQLLYYGLNKNEFNFSYTKNLYRGALMNKKELEEIIKHMEKNNNLSIPCGLVQSKAFMSFSLDKNVALSFLNKKLAKLEEKKKKKEELDEVGVFYILKSEVPDLKERILNNKNATNADLKDISAYGYEREILLFPFSIFEVCDIKKENDYYVIYLNILVKYKQYFYFKNQSDKIKSIYQSKYVKYLVEKDLIPAVMYIPKIVVHFIATDSSVEFSWVCKITDIFSIVEENLYHKYPNLKNKVYFLANGSMINTSSTLEQNKIKDDDVILICYID
jgi:hypothetical protein